MNLFLVLLVSAILNVVSTQNYGMKTGFRPANTQDSLIQSYNKIERFSCLAQCKLNSDCLSASLDSTLKTCNLYSKYFGTNQIIETTSEQFQLYSKDCLNNELVQLVTTLNNTVCINKGQSLLTITQKYQLRVRITSTGGNSFTCLHGFGQFNGQHSTMYYAIDYSTTRIHVFNEYWEFQYSKRVFSGPTYMLQIGNELFIAANSAVYKANSNLSVIYGQYTNNLYNRGICYNKVNDSILVGKYASSIIDVIDRNLTRLALINTNPHVPYSCEFYAGFIYVGTFNGYLLVIRASTINQTWPICPGDIIHSLKIDNYGNMALICKNANMLHFYHVNGTNFNMSRQVSAFSTDVKVDSNGRLILVNETGIEIYY